MNEAVSQGCFNAVSAELIAGGLCYPIQGLNLVEAVSRAFVAHLELGRDIPVEKALLNVPAEIHLCDAQGNTRAWFGYIDALSRRTVRVVSMAYRLKRRFRVFRTFMNRDVQGIVNQIFAEHGVPQAQLYWLRAPALVASGSMRVQCHETDYDFVMRLLAEQDIRFHSEHVNHSERLCFVPEASLLKFGVVNDLPYHSPDDSSSYPGETIGMFHGITHTCSVRTPKEPETPLEDWEALPKDELYSGVPSMLAGLSRAGMRLKPYVPLSYEPKALKEALIARQILEGDHSTEPYRYYTIQSNELRMEPGRLFSFQGVTQRVNYVEHVLTLSQKQVLYRNTFLLQPHDAVWRAVAPPKPDIPLTFRAIIESETDGVQLDENGKQVVRVYAQGESQDNAKAFAHIPRITPYAHASGGMHFPLHPGTEVILTCLYGEADWPVIMGAVPNKDTPSVVTAANATENVIKTPGGNHLIFDDAPNNIVFYIKNRDANQIKMKGQGDDCIEFKTIGGVIVRSGGKQTWQVGGAWMQRVGQSYTQTAKATQTLTSRQGSIRLSSHLDVNVLAQCNFLLYAKRHWTVFYKNLNITVDKNIKHTVVYGNATYTVEGATKIQTQNGIRFYSEGDLLLKTGDGKSGVKLGKDGHIVLFGNMINLVADHVEFKGNVNHSMSAETLKLPANIAPSVLENIPKFKPTPENPLKPEAHVQHRIVLKYPDSELDPHEFEHDIRYRFMRDRNGEIKLDTIHHINAMGLCEKLNEILVKEQAGLVLLSTARTQLICPDSGEPLASLLIDKAKLDENKPIEVLCLPPPVIVNLREDRDANDSCSRDTLTDAELNYFKKNGNTATVFIHGFNVKYGAYAKDKHSGAVLNVREEKTMDKSEGALAWYPNMEYNLNKAAGFEDDYRDKRYTRIIGMAWSGDVFPLDYLKAENCADTAAKSLSNLIKQLKGAGVEINIIAHSLGNRVLLCALNELAQDEANYNIINQSFLWQAACPDTALSNSNAHDSSAKGNWFLPHAYKASRTLVVLHSEHDEILPREYAIAHHAGTPPSCSFSFTGNGCTEQERKMVADKWKRRGMRPELEGMMEPIDSTVINQHGNLHVVRPALGYAGYLSEDNPAKKFCEDLEKERRLAYVDQKDWLSGHSAMKVPSEELMRNVYIPEILDRISFGKYK